jgi:hypothetical protein
MSTNPIPQDSEMPSDVQTIQPSQNPIIELQNQVAELSQWATNQSKLFQQQTECFAQLQDLVKSLISKPEPSKPKLPNIATPQPFDGSSTTTALSFLNSCHLYFEGRAPEFPTDFAKVYFAVSYLKDGKAKKWLDNLLQDGQTIVEIFPTWNSFVKAFRGRWDDPLAGDHARRLIKELQQGKGTVNDYISSFEEYEKKTGYDDLVLKEIFEAGLLSSILENIYRIDCMPTTLEGIKAKARVFDNQRLLWESLQKGKKVVETKPIKHTIPFTPKKPSVPSVSTSTGTLFGGSGQPMDIDAAKRAGLCFLCGQKGHIVKDCPHKKPVHARQIDMASMTKEELDAMIKQWNDIHSEKKDF